MKVKTISTVFLVSILGVLLSVAARVPQKEDPGVLLRAALEKEEVEGDLQGAIGIYEQIIAKHGSNRSIAAKAQLRIGICYEKLGKAEAVKAYELVLKKYADQPEEVATARARLAELRSDQKPLGDAVIKLPPIEVGVTPCGLSPDRTKILMISRFADIFVHDYSTEQDTFITDNRNNEKSLNESRQAAWYPVWSPDGREIAYVLFGSKLDWFEIWVSTLKGKARQLYRTEGTQMMPVDWLRDGSAIITAAVPKDSSPAEPSITLGLVPLEGGSFKPLRTIRNSLKGRGRLQIARSSPDGRFIVFEEGPKRGTRNLYIVSKDGRSVEALTNSPADDKSPLWSPDGNHIVFLSSRTGSWALWAVSVKNGKPAGDPFVIREEMNPLELLNWTAEGLAYVQQLSYCDVHILPVDPSTGEPTGEQSQASYTPTGVNGGPVWSPDGRHLAFISRHHTPERQYIVVLPTDGGKPREFLTLESRAGKLRWLPDCRGLGFFSRNKEGKVTLFKLTLETGEWTMWPIPSTELLGIELARSGKAYFYAKHGKLMSDSDDPPGIIEHNLETGQERYIYRTEKNQGDPVYYISHIKSSWDDRRLVFNEHYESGESCIVVLDLETGNAKKVTPVERRNGYPDYPAWSPDGRHILLVDFPDHKWVKDGNEFKKGTSLFIMPASGGSMKPFSYKNLPPKGSVLMEPDWSPDGKKIAFALWQGTLGPEVLLIKNVIPEDRR